MKNWLGNPLPPPAPHTTAGNGGKRLPARAQTSARHAQGAEAQVQGFEPCGWSSTPFRLGLNTLRASPGGVAIGPPSLATGPDWLRRPRCPRVWRRSPPWADFAQDLHPGLDLVGGHGDEGQAQGVGLGFVGVERRARYERDVLLDRLGQQTALSTPSGRATQMNMPPSDWSSGLPGEYLSSAASISSHWWA